VPIALSPWHAAQPADPWKSAPPRATALSAGRLSVRCAERPEVTKTSASASRAADRRNFRVTGEVTHDLRPNLTRVTFGIGIAF
jgi:hypothetical protein